MNADKLHKLQALAKEQTILYVENNLTIQNKLGNILEKIFNKVYKSSDGKDAYLKYLKFKPDIVLTDLTILN